ncbi:MAG: polyprenyl synthetase family protein [Planctomycetes bacterium]|nr:polyprenyl synthetase family protein [Planctomycetota bacterium]
MKTATPEQPDTTTPWALMFAPIGQDLAHVEHRLQSALHHDDPFIDELAQRSFRLGGKRLRPALLLLTAQAAGGINDSHHTLAAVVEMIHTATLVHDDVLDEAAIRRHEDTINARWNNQTSILLGDYLFSQAFYLASSLDTTFGCRTIGRSTNIVCEGELLQTAASGNFDLSREQYFRIIGAKTAELCACCCSLGAHYAGADEQTVERFETFGQQLGIAFQIADDLLDLVGEEQTVGKSLGTDLTKRRMTLPLIMLRDQLDSTQQRDLQALLDAPNDETSSTLKDWLQSSGSLQQTRELALTHAAQAAEQLALLADSPAKQSLLQLPQAAVSRCV